MSNLKKILILLLFSIWIALLPSVNAEYQPILLPGKASNSGPFGANCSCPIIFFANCGCRLIGDV